MSISQQELTLSRKKTIVFSTKASQTTKENIANIYGAKTLTALVPLDLKLELQPTLTQVLKEAATQSEDASKALTIAGHVSRPVFGEGRSTPDRQMFFVNSRPCLLPQIAKAFNEVYKSYNVTQSPFVFANLLMDTNAYDVNVSPDKRTILLHDQTSLLEALKQSLIDLFEAQEQTVPQSQLQTSMLPSYRPVTVDKEVREAAKSAAESPANAATPRPKYFPSSPVAASSKDTSEAPSTYSQGGQPAGLMSKFVGRNLQDREDVPIPARKAAEDQGPSNDKQRLTKRMQEQGRQIEDTTTQEAVSVLEEEDGFQTQVARPVSRPVQDFNARVASQQARSANRSTESLSVDPMNFTTQPPSEDEHLSPEPSTRPNKQSSDETQSAFDRVRPVEKTSKSIAPSLPTSTIPSAVSHTDKKRKLSIPGPPKGRRPQIQSSQFASRMHAFAAPGSQLPQSTTKIANGIVDKDVNDGDEQSQSQPPYPDARRSSSDSALFVGDEDDDCQSEPEDQSLSKSPSDEEYVDEEERRRRDDAKVEEMVRQAEATAQPPTQQQDKRVAGLMRSSTRKDSTIGLMQFLETTASRVDEQLSRLTGAMESFQRERAASPDADLPPSSKTSPEERLSLTIAKSDFANMKIIGQFNLGFILATRPSHSSNAPGDELFIIDQHASDEIYNFHRLSANTTLTPQPLVRPHPLELTAVEEETILSHTDTLAKNGFNITIDESGDSPVGQRCQLLTLPTSRETVFDTRDLEELISLLSEATPTAGEVIRPTKVRKMLAMRACRSSIMVGRTLTQKSMESVVRHMGEIDKPWNCPHGRPTMRHLASLGEWGGWEEGEGLVDDDDLGCEGGATDWAGYLGRAKKMEFAAGGGGKEDEDGQADVVGEDDEMEVPREEDEEAIGSGSDLTDEDEDDEAEEEDDRSEVDE